MTIKVFLADDHTLVCDCLRLFLEAQNDMEVVGDAADGRQAVSRVTQIKPDVVLMDMAMPSLNGIEATQQIREASPSTRVIVLSMYSTPDHISQSLEAGAWGYLMKESAGAEVIKAIRTVHGGRRYLSEKIPAHVIDQHLSNRKCSERKPPLANLSPREREVLQLVVEGKSSAEIAGILFLSPKTVETYRSRLMQKLGVSGLADLVKYAIQHGLTPLR
jgi:two-component system, NarL family, response regulator NreC